MTKLDDTSLAQGEKTSKKAGLEIGLVLAAHTVLSAQCSGKLHQVAAVLLLSASDFWKFLKSVPFQWPLIFEIF